MIGRRAPSAEEVSALAASGARSLTLALHGARAEVHEWVASAPGDYVEVIRALGVARGLELVVRVETRVTRSSARVLSELPTLLRARGVAAWTLVIEEGDPETPGLAPPRLALVVPAALAALARARELGLEVEVEGVPRCLLGPYAELARPSAPRAFAAACEGCAARAACVGVSAMYLATFGGGELRRLTPTGPKR